MASSFRAGVSGLRSGRSIVCRHAPLRRFSCSRIIADQVETTTATTETTAPSQPSAADIAIPFSKLPYQCFQEARKILALDRQERIKEIEAVRAELEEAKQANDGDLVFDLEEQLEALKIRADFNDPLVQLRFEEGRGDMNRPVYRHLADQKWRSFRRKIIQQRLERMSVIPDVLPNIDLNVDIALSFGGLDVEPGAFVGSDKSESAPVLKVQSFRRGQRTVSIVVVDPDVPNVATDSFKTRCHFMAVNVPLSASSPEVILSELDKQSQVIFDWLPPFAQQGTPYHRLSVFVLDQTDGRVLNAQELRDNTARDGLSLRQLVDSENLNPSGGFMFRTVWDQETCNIMKRNEIDGADVLFRRRKPEKLPYKKKDSKRYR